jgi:hypothetical protein
MREEREREKRGDYQTIDCRASVKQGVKRGAALH